MVNRLSVLMSFVVFYRVFVSVAVLLFLCSVWKIVFLSEKMNVVVFVGVNFCVVWLLESLVRNLCMEF